MNTNSVEIEDFWPLAPLQAAMLVASLRAPESGVFIQQEVMSLPEPVDARAFQVAWDELVQRTPALRTSFHWQDLEQPVQVAHRHVALAFEQLDWRHLDAAAFEAQLVQYLGDSRRAGFALDRPPLIRLSLIRGRAGQVRFVWQFHHILLDGWSAQLLAAEMIEHYRALVRNVPYRPPVRRSLRHYIDWLATRDLEAAREYWANVLRGYDEPVEIGLPRPFGRAALAEADTEVSGNLDAEESARLRAFARQHGLTLNTVLQGAWALLLGHYTDRDDVVFGAVVSGRPPEVPGIEQMIGLFINAVPVRVRVDPQAALVPWLKDLQSAQARGSAFHHLDSAELQRCSEISPDRPLFDTLVVFENFPQAAAKLESATGGLDLARANVPLSLLAVPGDRLHLKLRFDRSRFHGDDMGALVEHLLNLLRGMYGAPFATLATFSPLSDAERRRLIEEPTVGDADARVELDPLELLRGLARDNGAAPAFIVDDRMLDFDTLERASSRLARRLHDLGVDRGVPVAVSAPRSLEQVVAFYAVLKAHGVYLPLDPAYPRHRLEQMLADAKPAVLLATGPTPPDGPATVIDIGDVLDPCSGDAANDEPVCWRRDDPAYIVFTSGSTGRPKGVLVQWGQVSNRLTWMWQAYPFGANEMACQRTAINFVDSLWELLGATLQGVPTLIVSERIGTDASALIRLLASRGVTRLWLVPSLLKMMLEAQPDLGRHLPHLLFWVCSGEPLHADLYQHFRRHHPEATLYNLYGTSEVWDATWFDPDQEPPVLGVVPIGRPIAGVRAYVLDSKLRPVPLEMAGELCIGGVGVALGYLGPAELTRERFVTDPFAGSKAARMYRTGDLARVQRDGLIVCLGRRDQQIKLRGFRIEPAEIEALLRQAPEVRDAMVVLREGRLVAYVAAPASSFDARRLLAGLRERLPQAFLPTVIARFDALPLTPNGKRDRLALPPPEEVSDAGDTNPVLPFEKEVQACFAQVLQLHLVALDGDFFLDLGGHSLAALRVSSRLSRQLGIDVPAGAVFDHPSVRQLARWIAECRAATSEASDEELLALLTSMPAAEREALLASQEPAESRGVP
ncbi:non-ribosomal peptide synthetase [Mesorhizobium kowhaii]|uniref:Carrier domain-containing protein n=1 Tax=Mesorhizobium kowhaii TaxID=1300272 RepID=A0A2W7BVQ8_9HYPH|nr:non-ribosomal peptide synthetase [Mesorhizobium kowhaii]PZV34684.1 hypothetical protein B5V02_31755 [Mesorhizobium kowhaii]